MKNGTTVVDGDIKPNLEVIIQTGEESLDKNLKFTWEITSFNKEDGLKLQLNFESPEFVSSN